MRKLVLTKEYPGANYILRPDGKRKRISPDLKEDLAKEFVRSFGKGGYAA